MKQRIALFFCCLLLCSVFSSCAQEPEPEPEETYPVTVFGVKFERSPSSVISLSPVITEMLVALGYEDRLIARTDGCDFDERLASLPSIGSGINPDIEQLVSLNPDLVLTVRPLSKQALEALGTHNIRAVTVPLANNLRELQSYYSAVGCIFAGTDPGIALGTSTVQPYIDKLINLQKSLPTEKINFLLLSDLSGTVITGDSFASSLLSYLGNNVAEDGTQNQYDINTALMTNPDTIFIYNPFTLENLQADPMYAQIEAVVNHRVFSIDGTLFERKSLSSVDVICELAEKVYSEANGTGSEEEPQE